MILPQSLNKGDKVIILSPAGKVEPGYVEGAAQVIMKKGYVPIISKNALGENGTYSGTLEERTQDLINAIADREIKAIFCSRGGYGVVHLIKSLDPQFLIENPKWVIG